MDQGRISANRRKPKCVGIKGKKKKKRKKQSFKQQGWIEWLLGKVACDHWCLDPL